MIPLCNGREEDAEAGESDRDDEEGGTGMEDAAEFVRESDNEESSSDSEDFRGLEERAVEAALHWVIPLPAECWSLL